jgi:hypothetical protein
MNGHARGFVNRLVVLMAAGIILAATSAFAAPPASTPPPDTCSPEQRASMEQMAQARNAESKAINDELFVQDDSVLALTCFSLTASVMGQQAGKTFSGDFRHLLMPTIDSTLKSYYSNFKDHTFGDQTGEVDYDSDTTTADSDGMLGNAIRMNLSSSGADLEYKCNVISKLWNAVNNQGIPQSTPYTTQSQLTKKTPPPTGGTQYEDTKALPNNTNASTNAATTKDAVDATQKQAPTNCDNCISRDDTLICRGSLGKPASWVQATACP